MEWWLVILLTLLAVAAVGWLVTIVPASMIKRRMLEELHAQRRGQLVLTYDDGPGPLMHEPLLQLLKQRGDKASFFLVGFRALRFPDQMKALIEAGHEVGNHTHWHRNAWRVWPWMAVGDVLRGYRSMSPWMARDAPFRPPFGKLTTWTWLAAQRQRARMCFWTHDGADTWKSLPEPESIVRAVDESGGGVVLLHSHDRGEDRRRYVLRVTELLLNLAHDRGWRVCTMSEFLQERSPDARTAAYARAHVRAHVQGDRTAAASAREKRDAAAIICRGVS